MTHFKAAHATAEDWAHVAQACVDRLAPVPEGANLGFVYATDVLADDFASILAYLRQKTGVEHWVGTVGLGICASNAEYFDRPALAVMVARLPPEGFRVFPALSREGAHLPDDSRTWAARSGAPFAIVHGDPTNAHTPALIDTVAEDTTGFLVGGLTSSRGPCHQVAGRITGGGVSGVLFSPHIEVATGLTQGCAPFAGTHIITDGLDNVIVSLDSRRALDVFKEDIGELLARDLKRAAGYIHAAFPIEGSDLNDYMVRNIIGIDLARGWIAVGGEVRAGHRVMFVRRDPKSAEADLVRMLETLKRRLPGAPKGGVYFSCVARGANMFGREGREMELIRERLGDFPLVGFYAGGEISNCRLYGYTGVLALFL